ncbi:hypothetical protein ASPSYDRAFT_88075 [Aspergillus sydowii CBS 593.65]|uniref:DUF7587 domain-containing protein n=1 Tax=Aspergillus sydowii CBS 593.65 TaxID=1036612 RepID=A0A1L9TQF6_9EURO|nr:uncharacterized protein ASPSYDRAFT_88075 [Aspergillus sydowii CBS 593.65]OJJ61533.1 hypothetical protein ASPSYDRAFT_88075 [Aspergillus sydowii CBS 593.65]
MDALRTDINELPPRFYRVQPGRSRVAWDELGFHSSSRASLDSEEQMIEAIQRRLDWENVQDSPFIPVFSDYQKAHTWALALTTLGVTDVRIAEINTSELVGAIMLSVKRAQHLLGPNIPADDRHDGEWLIMDCIPSAAIVQWIGSEEINQDFRRIWGSGDHAKEIPLHQGTDKAGWIHARKGPCGVQDSWQRSEHYVSDVQH